MRRAHCLIRRNSPALFARAVEDCTAALVLNGNYGKAWWTPAASLDVLSSGLDVLGSGHTSCIHAVYHFWAITPIRNALLAPHVCEHQDSGLQVPQSLG